MKKIIVTLNPTIKKVFEQVANKETKVCVLGEALAGYGPCDVIVIVGETKYFLESDWNWIDTSLKCRLGPEGQLFYAH